VAGDGAVAVVPARQDGVRRSHVDPCLAHPFESGDRGRHARAARHRQPFPGIRPQDLDGNGNLKVPVDYRQIYTELLGNWMGTDPAAVIPNAGSFSPLALVA
jgi:hypothetical protein